MYIIGIAGGSGSGKTTFTEKIMSQLNVGDVVLLHQDNYYLDGQPKTNEIDGQPNFDSPEAFDWTLLKNQLSQLKAGKKIKAPLYDFKKSARKKETLSVGPCRVILVEGILALYDEPVRDLFDVKVYLKVDADIRFIRRLHRDLSDRGRNLDDVINQYYNTVRPMYLRYTSPTQQYADIIVGEHHDVAVEIVTNQIKTKLSV